MSTTIKLRSSDGEIMETSLEVIGCFGTLKTMLDLGIPTAGSESEVIPLMNVDGQTLRKIIDWAEHHKTEDVDRNLVNEAISDWDREFLNVDKSALFALILAANYLDIKLLFDIACKTVASMIKGKSPEQIRTEFNIVNDL